MTPLWLTIYGVVLLWSAINPKDTFTWWLEVIPALVAFVLLFTTVNVFSSCQWFNPFSLSSHRPLYQRLL